MRAKKELFIEEELPERRPTTRYNAPINYGLTKAQVQEYMDNGWDNRSVEPPSKSVKEIVKSNCLTYFNFIFIAIGILLVIVGSFKDLTCLIPVALNTLIGIFQEIQAKKTLDKLSVLSSPKAHVIRDGKAKAIAPEKLVLDDLVIFTAGSQICADAMVVDGEVSVNESLLTGESDEIVKKTNDHLMSGSFIVSGNCIARLEKVGEDSYISKLTLQAKATKEGEQSEMIRALNKLLFIVGIAIVPIGIMLFVQQFFINHSDLKDSITSMVAAIIGMIPEGLFLLASVALAVSAIRLATKKVLVHDMKCIETLARVNVLCVDKTGTITENTMKVHDLLALPAYNPETMDPLEEILSDFAASQASDNITMEALQERFVTPGGMRANQVQPFSSKYKYSASVFGKTTYILGAPEFVLRSDYHTYQDQIEEFGNLGYRVLVFGIYDGPCDGKELTETVTPLCLLTISNPIRKDAKDTFTFFHEQGVEVKVISGDNPVTVSMIAKQAGIANADRYVDASILKSKDSIDKAIEKYTVFGRVTPEQKRMIIKALKSNKKTVAMTGDGVNDVLALKDADCSIAMASGSDAAAQASNLVLLDSDFSHMKEVVMEGRRVVNNLERSGSLFLVKNIFSLLVALFSIMFTISYPLQPSQISLISMFTIGVPGFFLSMIPNTKLIKGKFMTNILLRALPAGLTDAFIVAALVIFGKVFQIDELHIATAATILLSIVGFMILFHISKPMNAYKTVIFLGSILGLLICALGLSNLFGINSMSLQCVMLFVIFSIITEPLFRYSTKLIYLLRVLFLKLSHREDEIADIS